MTPVKSADAPAKTARAAKSARTAAPVHIPVSDLPPSKFQHLKSKVYDHRYRVELHVGHLVGGTPTDPKVAEGWIMTKMGQTSAEQVAAAVEEVMEARGVKPDAAAEIVARNRNLSGFKRDFTTVLARQAQERAVQGVKTLNADNQPEFRIFTPEDAALTFGELYIEGRQVKAMIKEATNIALGAGAIEARGWGATRKGITAFLVEHMFVPEEKIYLGVVEPNRVNQSFVHTWRGSGIKMEEIVDDAVLEFTLLCDYDFDAHSEDFWGKVFVRAEMNGLGASRSQGFGTFSVTKFDRIS